MNRNGVLDASDKYVWLGPGGRRASGGRLQRRRHVGDGDLSAPASGGDLNRNGAWEASDGLLLAGPVGRRASERSDLAAILVV